MNTDSPRLSLNKADLYKTGRGFLIVLAGTTLTFIASNIGNFDFGPYTALVVAMASSLVELGRRYLAGYSA